MPDETKTSAPTASKPAEASQPKPVALATAAPAAKSTPIDKPAPTPAVKPVPTVKAAAAEATPPKAKRGRPLGAKSKPKPVMAKPIAAKPAPVVAAAAKAPIPKIVKKLVAPLAAATPSEGSKTMNDTIATMQDTAKKFTGEASARAKGAYEKSVKLTEEFTEFQKGNVEAFVESSKLAAKAAETLGQEAADYARKSYETTTAAFKTFASAKSPTEFFKLQSDYVKSYFDSAVAESSKVTESWLKLAGEVTQPLSNRMAVAVEKARATAAF